MFDTGKYETTIHTSAKAMIGIDGRAGGARHGSPATLVDARHGRRRRAPRARPTTTSAQDGHATSGSDAWPARRRRSPGRRAAPGWAPAGAE